MDQQDLLQIKQIVDESIETKVKPLIDESIDTRVKPLIDESIDTKFKTLLDNAIETKIKPLIDESIENLAEKTIKPSFDEVYSRLDKVEGRLNELETKVDVLPDKDYLDRKIAELKGDTTVKFRKHEKKIEILTESQKRNNLLSDDELAELKELNIFPTLENLKPAL